MTILTVNDALIGDFLGTIPVMQHLSRLDKLKVIIPQEAYDLFDLIPDEYGIELFEGGGMLHSSTKLLSLDISAAFTISHQQSLFMSQAHFAYLGLPVPSVPPRAHLSIPEILTPAYDVIIAPFSRSLPESDKWAKERWQELVDAFPNFIFCIIGHGRDPKGYVTGPNVCEMYSRPIAEVAAAMLKARAGLISVVSGPSHLAFHLGVKNILLTNQKMTWGNNPAAVHITTTIANLKVDEVAEALKKQYTHNGCCKERA